MFINWILAAAGQATPTAAQPAFDANSTAYGLAGLTWLGRDTWPRFDIDTPVTATDATYNGFDGSKFYTVIGGSSAIATVYDSVKEFSLYDAERFGNVQHTATYSLGTQDTQPIGLVFGDSGTKMYVCGQTNDLVYQYSLSVPYSVATASYGTSYNPKSLGPQPSKLRTVAFTHNGRKMYVLAQQGITLPAGNGYAASRVITQHSLSTAWNIGTARWDGIYAYPRIANPLLKFNGATLSRCNGLQVNGDGSRMWVVADMTPESLVELRFETDHGIGNLVVGPGFAVNGQDSTPQDLYVNAAGDRVYMIGSSTDSIYQYNVGTPGQLNTASYANKSIAVGLNTAFEETTPTGLSWSPDGSRLYFAGLFKNTVFQVSVSTPWELDSAAVSGNNGPLLSITEVEKTAKSLRFSPDGLKFFIAGVGTNASSTSVIYISEWQCQEPWKITGANFSGVRLNTSGYDILSRSFGFTPDGYTLYVLGSNSDKMYYWTLSTAYSLSGAVFQQVSPILPRRQTHTGVRFNDDGTKMYLVETNTNRVTQYRTPAAYYMLAIYQNIFRTTGSVPYDLAFKPDGTRMYVTQSTSKVVEYGLSTPWTVNTVSYTRSLNNPTTLLGSANPHGIEFRDDGTEVFLALPSTDQVVRLTLTEPWNITTAYKSYVSGNQPSSNQLVVTADIGRVASIAFSADGRYLYVAGQATSSSSSNSKIVGYYLSQPWEVSSAAFSASQDITAMNITAAAGSIQGISVSTDGRFMYFSMQGGTSRDSIIRGRFASNFDISSLVVDPIESGLGWYTLPSTMTPTDLVVKPDLTRFYVADDQATDRVVEFSLGTAELINTATQTAARNNTLGSTALSFDPGGTRMFVLGSRSIYRYTLPTAWDITTATLASDLVGSGYRNISNGGKVKFSADGTRAFVLSFDRLSIVQWQLTQPWDMTTATIGASYAHGQGNAVTGLDWSYDGQRCYMTATGNSSSAGVLEFTASSSYSVSSLSYVRRGLTAPELSPQGLYLAPDGSAMWVVGLSRNTILHYSLSIAYNVNTATLAYELTMLADRGGTGPRDLVWADHGRRFIVLSSDTGQSAYLHEYSTSQPFATNLAQWQRTAYIGTLSTYTKLVRGVDYGLQGRLLLVAAGDINSNNANGLILTYSLAD